MNQNNINLILDSVFIKYAHSQLFAGKFFNSFFRNRGRVFAELLSVFHTAGATPDNLPGWAGNAPVVMITLSANQKATQYTLRVVPGDLALVGIFIDVARLLFSPCAKKKSSKLMI